MARRRSPIGGRRYIACAAMSWITGCGIADKVDAALDASGRITRIQAKLFSPLEVDEPARLFLDGWIALPVASSLVAGGALMQDGNENRGATFGVGDNGRTDVARRQVLC